MLPAYAFLKYQMLPRNVTREPTRRIKAASAIDSRGRVAFAVGSSTFGVSGLTKKRYHSINQFLLRSCPLTMTSFCSHVRQHQRVMRSRFLCVTVSKAPINAVTVHVGTGPDLSGFATNQELGSFLGNCWHY